MTWRSAWTLVALSCLGTSLAGCATSSGPPAVNPYANDLRVTLPPTPDGLEACFRREFPEIADRDLSQADVVKIIASAKVLDRAKSRCGARALAWISAVRRDFAR